MSIPCYICARPTDIRLDPRDDKPRPCGTCEEIIAEAVSDLDDDHVFMYTDTVDDDYVEFQTKRDKLKSDLIIYAPYQKEET